MSIPASAHTGVPFAPARRSCKRVILMSFAMTFVAAAALLAVLIVTAAPAEAAVCTWSGGAGNNWSVPSNWSGCAGLYPGQSATDTASIAFSTVIVDSAAAIAFPVGVSGDGSHERKQAILRHRFFLATDPLEM